MLEMKLDSNNPLKESSGKSATCLQLIHRTFLVTNLPIMSLRKILANISYHYWRFLHFLLHWLANESPKTEQLQDIGCICWFVMSVPDVVLRYTTTNGRLAVRGALKNHPVMCIHCKDKGLLMSRSDTMPQNPI